LGPPARRLASLAGGTQRQRENPEENGEGYRFDAGLARERAREFAAREAAMRARVVPHVARFFAPSRFLRAALLDWGLPPDRVEYLEYGLEQDPFAHFERGSAERMRVRFLGTLAFHKGPHLLLQAWASLPSELRARGELLISGAREPKSDYVARLERLGAACGAHLTGAIRRADVPRALERTDLLVVPSIWYENSPLTIHEARLTRTPLLVSNLGGMAELVEDSREGWRFQVGDVRDLAARLAALLNDPSQLKALRFDGPPVASMKTSAFEMERRYRALLDGEGGEGGGERR